MKSNNDEAAQCKGGLFRTFINIFLKRTGDCFVDVVALDVVIQLQILQHVILQTRFELIFVNDDLERNRNIRPLDNQTINQSINRSIIRWTEMANKQIANGRNERTKMPATSSASKMTRMTAKYCETRKNNEITQCALSELRRKSLPLRACNDFHASPWKMP